MSEEYTLKEYLCTEIEKLKMWHDNNKVRCTDYFFMNDISKEAYSSLKRRALFNNTPYIETAYDDVYLLMVQIYKHITGKTLRLEHRLNKQWLVLLESKIQENDVNVKKAIISLIKICMKQGAYLYIKNINDVIQMEEYEVIKNAIRKDG